MLIGLAVSAPAAAYAQTAPPVQPVAPVKAAAPANPLAPAPFPMPMDAGPKALARAAAAKRDLADLEPELAATTKERDRLQERWDRLTAELDRLHGVRVETIDASGCGRANGSARARPRRTCSRAEAG